eukprot:1194427-Prorocentrum_minimum.AAC.6
MLLRNNTDLCALCVIHTTVRIRSPTTVYTKRSLAWLAFLFVRACRVSPHRTTSHLESDFSAPDSEFKCPTVNSPCTAVNSPRPAVYTTGVNSEVAAVNFPRPAANP